MPVLEVFQSLWAMERRRPDGKEWSLDEKVEMIAEAGYDGIDVVHGDPNGKGIEKLLARFGLAATITAFPKGIDDLKPAIAQAKDFGVRHLNIIGQVFPFTVAEGARFVNGWLDLCERADMPVTIETHRDCLTTDMLYTLQLMEAVPQMRLCADLSHFVVGREFSWPISDTVHNQIQSVLDRADAFQGRVASREQIQIQISFPQHRDWFELFQLWWRRGFISWRGRAGANDRLNFLCELGPKEYAITGADGYELSDRWQEALAIKERVRAIWSELDAEGDGARATRP
ncbi:MAG: sugar phosphate isomerase/epimerase [Dongiaceae bacterium]